MRPAKAPAMCEVALLTGHPQESDRPAANSVLTAGRGACPRGPQGPRAEGPISDRFAGGASVLWKEPGGSCR